MRIVFQPFRLQLHGASILLYKFGEDEFQKLWAEGNPAEEIPGGYDVDAASVARDRSDSGQTREPIFSGANNFRAQVGQHEVNRRGNRVRVGVETQKLVGRAV